MSTFTPSITTMSIINYKYRKFLDGFQEVFDTFLWWTHYVRCPGITNLCIMSNEHRELWWDLYMNLSGFSYTNS